MPGGVNLIPRSRILARQRRHRIRNWCIANVIYAAVLGAAWLAGHLLYQDEHAALAGEMSSLRRQVEDDRAAVDRLRPRMSTALATIAAGRSVGDQPDWSLLLSLLAELLEDDAVLSSCELGRPTGAAAEAGPQAGRRFNLRLAGLGRSHGAVLGYVRKLEETQLFDAVKLIETRPEPFGSGAAIGFSIDCVLSDARREQP